MARHRSPQSRGAHPPSPSGVGPLLRAAPAPDGRRAAHRSLSTPLRRGATAFAVAGGTLTLVGAGVPIMAQSAHDANTTELASYTTLPSDTALPGPIRTTATPEPLPDPIASTTAMRPVAMDPQPDVTNGAALVKAVQLVEQQVAKAEADKKAAEDRKADQQKADQDTGNRGGGSRATGSTSCDLDTSDLGKVKAHVRQAAEIIGCMFGKPTMYGVAGRGGTSDHPGGLAVDFMVDTSTGNEMAECVLRNKDALGVKYVIWRQRINYGSGWKAMEDRGSVTANHFDHVHVSFESGAGDGDFGC